MLEDLRLAPSLAFRPSFWRREDWLPPLDSQSAFTALEEDPDVSRAGTCIPPDIRGQQRTMLAGCHADRNPSGAVQRLASLVSGEQPTTSPPFSHGEQDDRADSDSWLHIEPATRSR